MKKKVQRVLQILVIMVLCMYYTGTSFFVWAETQQGAFSQDSRDAVNVPILLYHHFADEIDDASLAITPDNFESHIKALADAGFTSVSFEQLIAYVERGHELPEKPVVITMDDGYSSNYEIAYPILKKYDTKATIFVVGSSVGKDTYKETNLPMIPHFSYSEAKEMAKSGLVSIQSHSYDMHQCQDYETQSARRGVLPFEDESENKYIKHFKADYGRLKSEIKTSVGMSPTVYSYPFGKYNDLTEAALLDMGVKATVTTNPTGNMIIKDMPSSLFSLNRFNISNDMTPDEIFLLIGLGQAIDETPDHSSNDATDTVLPESDANITMPETPATFELVYPTVGILHTTGENVMINVSEETKIIVLKGIFAPGQSVTVNRAGVYMHLDQTDPARTSYLFTVDTSHLAEGSGNIEFTVTINEPGKASAVHTMTIDT